MNTFDYENIPFPFNLLADEWKNFLQRVHCQNEDELRETEQMEEELRLWASYRGQTLTRTGILSLFFCHSCYYTFFSQ
jgi:hypothetical protein